MDAGLGVSMRLMKEPEGARPWPMDGRRVRRVMEGLRVLDTDGRRLGEQGAGEPGWTVAAQLEIALNVLERRRWTWVVVGRAGRGARGGEGRGWARFFNAGGVARKANWTLGNWAAISNS